MKEILVGFGFMAIVTMVEETKINPVGKCHIYSGHLAGME
jgi:hypothetical protein